MEEWRRHLHKGIEAMKQGDVYGAEAHYRESLRLNPTNTDALLNLAGIYYLQRKFDTALEFVERCIAVDPVRPQAHYQRGLVRSAMGDLSGALADFDTELRSHPDDLEVILSRGVTHAKLGNVADALANYEHATRLAPRDPRSYYNRGLLHAESDPNGALSDFSEAINCDPSHADAYFARGFLLRANGGKQEALADFRAFLHYNGSQPHRSHELAQTWIRELEAEVSETVLATPLSDLIDSHVKSQTHDSFTNFLEAFRCANVGVIALDIPPGATGDVTAMPKHPISLGSSKDGDGHDVVLAFADPDAFARTYGSRFNAMMSGEAVLQTAVHNPECYGVRVNSSKADISIVIDRQTAVSLLDTGKAAPTSSRRPWWKIW